MISNRWVNNIVSEIKKNLIQEGKFDSVIYEIYRDIINHFKKKQNFSEVYYVERGDEYAEFKVNCEFEEERKFNHPFSIEAEADFDVIDIVITYRPKDFPKSMSDLTAELKETITHEIEHIGQHNFEDMYMGPEKYYNNFEYLTSPSEIPAYVKGLIVRANLKRVSLSDAMDEWFKENINKFDNPKKEWPKVKETWMDFANEMRSKNKVKKFR
jgi:hypothetical protein